MGNSWFQFQQFRLNQDRCAMKISTDAVLLGALAESQDPEKILDIGTGTGVIALMLAQRFPDSKIQAVEVDEDAADQASENFKLSPFSERLGIFKGRFQEFGSAENFELIVSNPPYFSGHLKSPDPKRNKALHNEELPFADLAEKVSQLLSPRGRFWVILPPRQMEDFESVLMRFGLYACRKFSVRDNPSKPVLRIISEFSFERVISGEETIFIKKEDATFHSSYLNLVHGFLLGF
jgi:tRNA1Val (adenine37-N6)-methyltransferase